MYFDQIMHVSMSYLFIYLLTGVQVCCMCMMYVQGVCAGVRT